MIQVYAITTLILHVKYFIAIMYAANPDDHPEEDKGIFGEEKAPADIKRRQRTAANDIENIPFHFAIFWAAFIVQNLSNMSGNGDQETTALTCLVVIYAGISTLYSLCYVFALQPWRTVFFILSQLTVATTSCVLIASAFQVDTSKILPAIP